MTRLEEIRQRVERATKGPWRWGYWIHRPDLKKQGNIGPYTPFWEFREESTPTEDEFVLSTAEYGTVAEVPHPAYDLSIVSSFSAGHGGETSIGIRDEDKLFIARAREDIPALLAVVSAAKDLQSACSGKSMSAWSEDEEHALNVLEATLAPLLQDKDVTP